MVTADDVERSLRGAAALFSRRAEGLRHFEIDEAAFWRSFSAILLSAPAYIVSLALFRRRLGLEADGSGLFGDPGLAALVALGHVATFLALPLAMILLARRLGLGARYVPFVIVTNWISAYSALVLAVPGALLLLGWETPALARLFTFAFLVLTLQAQWFAAKASLQVGSILAGAVTALGFGLACAIHEALRAVA